MKEDLKYLENLLNEKGCPIQLQTPYAVQIYNDCKKNNKTVFEVEIS